MTLTLATLNRADANSETPLVKELTDELFTFAPWDEEQTKRGDIVRDSLKKAYMDILSQVPSSPTRTRALNMLTDVRMLANQAITFKGQI